MIRTDFLTAHVVSVRYVRTFLLCTSLFPIVHYSASKTMTVPYFRLPRFNSRAEKVPLNRGPPVVRDVPCLSPLRACPVLSVNVTKKQLHYGIALSVRNYIWNYLMIRYVPRRQHSQININSRNVMIINHKTQKSSPASLRCSLC